MKKLVSIFLALCMIVGLTGCIDRLSDEHLDLQVIAVNSLPAAGYYRGNQIVLLDEDSYGRQLFAYGSSYGGKTLISLLVSQQTTEKRAY